MELLRRVPLPLRDVDRELRLEQYANDPDFAA